MFIMISKCIFICSISKNTELQIVGCQIRSRNLFFFLLHIFGFFISSLDLSFASTHTFDIWSFCLHIEHSRRASWFDSVWVKSKKRAHIYVYISVYCIRIRLTSICEKFKWKYLLCAVMFQTYMYIYMFITNEFTK